MEIMGNISKIGFYLWKNRDFMRVYPFPNIPPKYLSFPPGSFWKNIDPCYDPKDTHFNLKTCFFFV